MPGDRTEKATPHHLHKAAQHGDRARSRDLMAGAAMLAGVFALGNVAQNWVTKWANGYRAFLRLGQPAVWNRMSPQQTAIALRREGMTLLQPLVLIFGVALLAAIAAGVAQGGGWSLNFEALMPKPERLNPVENLKNVFSLRGAVRLGKSLVPVAILGFFTARALAQQSDIPAMSTQQYPDLFALIYNLLLDGAWIFLGWAGIDYVMEWRSVSRGCACRSRTCAMSSGRPKAVPRSKQEFAGCGGRCGAGN